MRRLEFYAKGAGPCPLEEAKQRIVDRTHPWFGARLRRSAIHTALNALIQGSAARHTKLWMRACWREGIVPLLQMHDALDCSVSTREQGEMVARLGCEAVTLKVPMRVDLKFGRSWGDATHSWAELHGGPAQPAVTDCAVNGATQLEIPELVTAPTIELLQPPQVSLRSLIGKRLIDGKLCCPFHDDRTPSLAIYDDHFHCFGCGAHGDHVDWLMMIEGMRRDEALAVLEHANGRLVSPPRVDDGAVCRARALRLWQQAKPIAGTLAAQYLAERRRIDLAALPANIDQVLRFHPNCPFGSGVRHPCLLALMRDIAIDESTGIHRIALTPDANKIGRRMLGRGGAVKLWPASAQLIIGEGIETTLAAATRISHRDAPLQPAWSAVSAGALGRLPVVPGVERLLILVDHDLNGQGQAAAARCAERWSRAGRMVTQLKPKRPGTDFNDLIMEPVS